MIAPGGPAAGSAARLARVAGARRHRRAAGAGRAPRWRRCARRCGCDDAALYLPDADGQPGAAPLRRRRRRRGAVLRRGGVAAGGRLGRADRPARGRRRGWSRTRSRRPRRNWVILPLVTGERVMVGVVIASAAAPIRDRPAERDRAEPARPAAVGRASRPRGCGASCWHAAMERERRQLAAEVHDGLAQYLARGAPRAGAAGARPRAPDRGRRRRPPARPRAAAGALRRRARRPAPGDRGRRPARPRRRARLRARRGRARRAVTLAAARRLARRWRTPTRTRTRTPSRSPTPSTTSGSN